MRATGWKSSKSSRAGEPALQNFVAYATKFCMVFCDGSEKVFLNGEIAHRHHEPRLSLFGLRRQSVAAPALSEPVGAWILWMPPPKRCPRRLSGLPPHSNNLAAVRD